MYVAGKFRICAEETFLPAWDMWGVCTSEEADVLMVPAPIHFDAFSDGPKSQGRVGELADLPALDELSCELSVRFGAALYSDMPFDESDRFSIYVVDGGFWPVTKKWGVGIISRMTGKTWSFGGNSWNVCGGEQ